MSVRNKLKWCFLNFFFFTHKYEYQCKINKLQWPLFPINWFFHTTHINITVKLTKYKFKNKIVWLLKSFIPVYWCYPFLSRLLVKDHFFRVLRQLHLLDENLDNDVKSGAVDWSPGIYLTAETSGKTSARRPLMKTVQPVIISNGIPFHQMRSVGLHSTLWREKEGNDRIETCCPWSHGLQQKILLVRCSGATNSCLGSQPKAICHDCRVSHEGH